MSVGEHTFATSRWASWTYETFHGQLVVWYLVSSWLLLLALQSGHGGTVVLLRGMK